MSGRDAISASSASRWRFCSSSRLVVVASRWSSSAACRCRAARRPSSAAVRSVSAVSSRSSASTASRASASEFAGGVLDGGFVALLLDQRIPLVRQAGEGSTGILSKGALAGEVGSDLSKPALVGVARFGDAGFLGVQRLAGDDQPLQGLGSLSFGLPQPGQALGVGRPLGGFRRHRLHVVADCNLGIVEGEPRHGQRAFRRDPAQMEQDGLGLPDLLADVAVARRLPRLLLQRAKLGVHGDDDVVQAQQVGFGGLQAKLGLVPAGVQAGDAGGFLQQHPPLGRFGIDDGADTALTDQGRGIGAAGVVGE